MQTVSELYRRLLTEQNSWKEISLCFEDDEPDSGVTMNGLKSVRTSRGVFADRTPGIGNAISAEISVEMLKPDFEIARMAKMTLWLRIRTRTEHSEWLKQGEFFVDTREQGDGGALQTIKLHGYDAMLKAEQDYVPSATPLSEYAVVDEIATLMGVPVADSVSEYVSSETMISPVGYTAREVLQYVAVSSCGNFIVNKAGELELIPFLKVEAETNLLIDENGDRITFGLFEGEEMRLLV